MNQVLRHFEIENRVLVVGQWLIDNPKTSIHGLAIEFNVSKSQIHRDIHYLKHLNHEMYEECMSILRKHRKVKS